MWTGISVKHREALVRFLVPSKRFPASNQSCANMPPKAQERSRALMITCKKPAPRSAECWANISRENVRDQVIKAYKARKTSIKKWSVRKEFATEANNEERAADQGGSADQGGAPRRTRRSAPPTRRSAPPTAENKEERAAEQGGAPKQRPRAKKQRPRAKKRTKRYFDWTWNRTGGEPFFALFLYRGGHKFTEISAAPLPHSFQIFPNVLREHSFAIVLRPLHLSKHI